MIDRERIAQLVFIFHNMVNGQLFFVLDLGAIQDLLNSDDTSVHNSGMKMSSSEEKLSKMEEVVEKVVELYVENIGEKSHDLSTKIENMTVTTEKENKETSFAQPSRVEENETDEST